MELWRSRRSGGILVYRRGEPLSLWDVRLRGMLSFTLWCRADRDVYANSSSDREMLTILTIFGLWALMGHSLSPPLRRSLLVCTGSFGVILPRGQSCPSHGWLGWCTFFPCGPLGATCTIVRAFSGCPIPAQMRPLQPVARDKKYCEVARPT